MIKLTECMIVCLLQADRTKIKSLQKELKTSSKGAAAAGGGGGGGSNEEVG